MFGYIRPVKASLSADDFAAYQSAYCGICDSLHRRYGFAARFTVNYDLTFYAVLLMSVMGGGEKDCCRCPAKCFAKKDIITSQYIDRAADISVILYYYGMQDKIKDSKGLKSLGYRFLSLLLKKPFAKASELLPDFTRSAEEKLRLLDELEKQRCSSIDRAADTFASLLQASVPRLDDGVERPLRLLLYNIGRFIYITDALDDIKDDLSSGSYNPIIERFSVTAPELDSEVISQLDVLASHCIGLASSAIALLDMNGLGRITENIIYLGLAAVWKSVKDGGFQSKIHKRNGYI